MTVHQPQQSEINSIISSYSNGYFKKALKDVDNLINDFPDEALLFNIKGSCLKALGKLNHAVKSYEKAINIKSDYYEAYNNLGLTFHELKQYNDAVSSYEKALTISHDFAQAFNNLGNVLKELGRPNEALMSYEKAIAKKPNYVEALYNIGNIFKEQGQSENAIKKYEQALAIDPRFLNALNNLGTVLQDLGEFETAAINYKKALALKPDLAEAHNNLGAVFNQLGQLENAIRSYEMALSHKPSYAEAHNNLGIVYLKLNRNDFAIRSFERAIKLKPDFANAYGNHGNAMKRQKRFNEALRSYQYAFELNPDLNFIFGDLLHTKMYLCLWEDYSKNLQKILNNNINSIIKPFQLLALIDDYKIQKRNSEIFSYKDCSDNNKPTLINPYKNHQKIRVGYFSGDFREHPVSTLTANLYETHNREQFEIHAFSYGPDTNDAMNLRIKSGVDHFHDVQTMSHKDIALLVRSLEIDIAVDLGGYTVSGKTDVFAMSAAPIQLSYIGFLGTMGAPYYDYLIADEITIPKENQQYYSEKIAYLPSYQVNDSTESPPEIFFTRKDIGLPEAGFVFCCFNNTYKITPETFDSWLRILKGVEDSVLLIYVDIEAARQNLINLATKKGLDSSRLIFAKHVERDQYLARYRVVNLFLDTLPYNAATTASDALRMGLPVLTLRGNSFASRMAASVISAINLPELITDTREEYESLAIELATNAKKFKVIKAKLKENLLTAPLYDTAKFTENLESVYKVMYQRYHDGLEPDHIYIKND